MSLEQELTELNAIYQTSIEHIEILESLLIEARQLLRICKAVMPEGTATGELIEQWEEKARQMIGEGK